VRIKEIEDQLNKDALHVILVEHDTFLHINNKTYPGAAIINFCAKNSTDSPKSKL